MSQTRYCSTCGTLLSAGAAICGECGARYQASPYERRATDAPGAWSQAPRARSRDLGPAPEESGADEGIELISREELAPRASGSTALRTQEQYDQLMVTQPPPSQPGSGAPSGHPGVHGSPIAAGLTGPTAMPGSAGAPGPAGPPERAADAYPELEHPLDGCVPASPLKRFLAAVIDSVIASLTTLPLMIGLILIVTQESVTMLAQILVGLGAALPAAYTVLIIWLVGAKGFSLGKLILGLRVTRFREAGRIGVLRSLGRWVLYAVVWVVMALSIFVDPKKHLRGFHDRAVDSVVVDIKTGRNPLLPRPDDFERASAEHYLGAPSVPVTAHENLLAEPGAAWRGAPQAEHSGAQPPATGWAPEPSTPSPYAPPSPPMDGSGPPPMIGSPWSPPPPAPAAGTGAGDSTWGPPPPSPDAPAQQPQQPQQPVFPPPGPGPSAPQQPWMPPPVQPEQHDPSAPNPGWAPQPPAPMPAADPVQSSVPSELTTDAWDEGEIDEETRMVVPDHGDLGDLEQTRLSAATPPVPSLHLVTDDGTERTVHKPVVIGRNPSATDDQVLFVVKDDTRSVSKTHLQIDGTGPDVTVTDLGSTNGSVILREDGSRESLVPNTPTVLPTGATLAIGDRTLTVEKVQ